MFSLRVLVSVLYVQSTCVGECLVCSVYVCWWVSCMFSLRVLVSALYVQSTCVGECLVCSVYVCW